MATVWARRAGRRSPTSIPSWRTRCSMRSETPVSRPMRRRSDWRHGGRGAAELVSQVLGQRQARSAVPDLIGIVEEADDPYLVAEATVALARIGDPAGLAVVDRMARQGSAVARAAARTALRKLRPPPSGPPRPVEGGR